MEQHPKSEDLYYQHNEITRSLHGLDQLREELDWFYSGGKLKQFLKQHLYKSEFDLKKASKDVLQRVHDENIKMAREHIDSFHQEALETVKQWESYVEEQSRLSQETGADPVVSDINKFIRMSEDMRIRTGLGAEEATRLLAINDFFMPRTDTPLTLGELSTQYNSPVLRIDAGSDLPTALARAEEKELTYILKMKKTVKHILMSQYPLLFKDTGVGKPHAEADESYVAISAKTAELIAKLPAKKETVYLNKTHPIHPDFVLEFEMLLLPLADARKEAADNQVTLYYNLLNTETNLSEPKEIILHGKNLPDVYHQAVRHIIDIETGSSSLVAKNVKVGINDKIVPFQEFEESAASFMEQ